MAMSKEQVFEKVREVLVDALGVDDDEVTMEAKLVDDLGAESIDFLDIVFRLEKAFGIKVNQGEMFPESVLSDPTYVKEGKVTDTGIAELKKRLDYVDLTEFEKERSVQKFPNVFTVEAIVKFVMKKQGQAA